MMRSTAGNVVASLQRSGLVRESNAPASKTSLRDVGRPGKLVAINPDHAWFLGADVGVDYLRLVAVDLQGQQAFARSQRFERTSRSPERTIEVLVNLVADAKKEAPTQAELRLCLSLPGTVDLKGQLKYAPFLDWRDVPYQSMVEAALPDMLEVKCENDAVAFALSELLKPNSVFPDDCVFLWLDSGVGGAIRSGGQLQRGHNGFAGEFGHIYVGDNPMSPEGVLAGSLESFIGRSAILNRYEKYGGSALDFSEFVCELDRREGAAMMAAKDTAQALARGISTIAYAIDPQTICLGGTVSEVFQRSKDLVESALQSMLVDPTTVPALAIAESGDYGAAVGCAMSINHEFFQS